MHRYAPSLASDVGVNRQRQREREREPHHLDLLFTLSLQSIIHSIHRSRATHTSTQARGRWCVGGSGTARARRRSTFPARRIAPPPNTPSSRLPSGSALYLLLSHLEIRLPRSSRSRALASAHLLPRVSPSSLTRARSLERRSKREGEGRNEAEAMMRNDCQRERGIQFLSGFLGLGVGVGWFAWAC